jgi:hypothetical protein
LRPVQEGSNVSEWSIQRVAAECTVTRRAFNVGDAIWSALFEYDTRMVRADISEAAWTERLARIEAGETPEAPKILITVEGQEEPQEIQLVGEPLHFWRHVKPALQDKPKRRYVDDAVLLDFFRRLEESTDEKKLAFRYMLGLHLIRRKKLVLSGVEKDGADEFLVLTERKAKRRRKKSDEPDEPPASFRVLDPRLSEDEINELRGQMHTVLEMEEELDAEEAEPVAQSAE